MWPRLVMLLVVLIAPTASLAATVCCDEPATDECCGPVGDCPASDDGDCALIAAGEALQDALPEAGLLALSPCVQATLAVPRATPASESPPALAPAPIPRYLLLQTFRN